MKDEFKAGDLVFEGTVFDGIILSELKPFDFGKYTVEGNLAAYTREGFNSVNSISLTKIFHATPENRQALVTLYGEDAVPKLLLSPQEITMKLLENQKYQLCKVSNHSTDWNRNDNLKAIVHIGVSGEFFDSNGWDWTYGIPVDNNGNEIKEIE